MVVTIKIYYTLTRLGCVYLRSSLFMLCGLVFWGTWSVSTADDTTEESVEACVLVSEATLSNATRARIARCLGFETQPSFSICEGRYRPIMITPLADADEVHILADKVSLYTEGRSELRGHVDVRQTARVVSAKTATVYRSPKTHQVTNIVLLGNVQYREPNKMMWAKRATINPNDKSGVIEDVLYRFSTDRAGAILPAWGRATWVQRFANQNYLLRKATYTTCSPKDRAWQIEADTITLDNTNATGTATNAVLRVADMPLLYAPYFSFPTSSERKSGFLMPVGGYSNVGGFDLALPYYWNIAPNYDATFVPHLYTRRGLMMGGDARFLTEQSAGIVGGTFLQNDRAFEEFLINNRDQYPLLQNTSSNRWSFLLHDHTQFNSQFQMNLNYQQVSDDYYFQDFSTNLAYITENQLLRQGDMTYTTDHWLLSGMVQSYQTLHPINQSMVANIYERLPQLLAQGSYNELPLNAQFDLLGQFDYFRWTNARAIEPQGPRYHLNPVLSLPQIKPWGYVTPEVQFIDNHYNLSYGQSLAPQTFNYAIPRYSLDSGLTFERTGSLFGDSHRQTLEPRLYYLYVPYQNQSSVPAFDSAYTIFNTDQLFRTNRFSGFDRIGDTNQLSYAATSRWLSEATGKETASVTVGQSRYFSNRRVQLCYRKDGNCIDSPLFLGYLSPDATTSPIASNAVYRFNSTWIMSGDYVWDTATRATNNRDINLHYQPALDRMVSFGYTYLVNGNIIELRNNGLLDNALHQATVAYAWPVNEKWSTLGAYSYNVSKGYGMMTFFGVQYDSCCWATRLLGGHTFKNLSPINAAPQYNNNVYVQILLKGLGSVANSDPATTIRSYLPGYANMFQH